jgi:hypothetical protein
MWYYKVTIVFIELPLALIQEMVVYGVSELFCVWMFCYCCGFRRSLVHSQGNNGFKAICWTNSENIFSQLPFFTKTYSHTSSPCYMSPHFNSSTGRMIFTRFFYSHILLIPNSERKEGRKKERKKERKKQTTKPTKQTNNITNQLYAEEFFF